MGWKLFWSDIFICFSQFVIICLPHVLTKNELRFFTNQTRQNNNKNAYSFGQKIHKNSECVYREKLWHLCNFLATIASKSNKYVMSKQQVHKLKIKKLLQELFQPIVPTYSWEKLERIERDIGAISCWFFTVAAKGKWSLLLTVKKGTHILRNHQNISGSETSLNYELVHISTKSY